MRSGPLSLVFGLLSLSTLGVYANNNQCTSGKYSLLVSSLSQDRYGREYCASLPPSHRLDRSKCPAALKNYKYEEIKTVCSCVNEKCKKPKCYRPETCCAKACGGYCSDLSKDSKNCGSCGHKCSDGKKCISGKCKTPQPACGYGQERCNGACKDKTTYQTDKDNCGKCGTKCTDGQTCTAGKCMTPPTPDRECEVDSDCGGNGGRRCTADGFCIIDVREPSLPNFCQSDARCRPWQFCQSPPWGRCRPRACDPAAVPTTCPEGSFCSESSQCLENPPRECENNDDCGAGRTCIVSVGTCVDETDETLPVKLPIVVTCRWTGCPAWQTCSGQKCTPKSCASATDCPTGSPCVSGGCQAPPSA